ncbi:MAG: GGDEF domain-containing protein, partial [Clostridiales bacterium]|nr:GGDEF domain-containing protein [Clostridiales bacterium]
NLTIAAETRQKQIRDRLTNAYNQAYLEEIIEKRLRDHEQFHLIFFNIIDFKSINSTHGREVGDEVLKHFTGFLQKLVSSSDKVFRYEGNEFCVLIELKNHGSEAINKLEKPRKIMYESFQNGIIKYHYAIGAYHYEGLENITFSEIMNIADQKIYCSKFT